MMPRSVRPSSSTSIRSSRPIGVTVVGSSISKYLRTSDVGLGQEGGLGRRVEGELGPLGVVVEGGAGVGEAGDGGVDGAVGGLEQHQPLERRVHEGALDRGHRGRVGEAVDGREAERQRALGEGRDLRR